MAPSISRYVSFLPQRGASCLCCKLVSAASSPMPKKGMTQQSPAMPKKGKKQLPLAMPKKRKEQLPSAKSKKTMRRPPLACREGGCRRPGSQKGLPSAKAAVEEAAGEAKAAVEEAAAVGLEIKIPKKKKDIKKDKNKDATGVQLKGQNVATQEHPLKSQNGKRTVSRNLVYAACWNLRLTCPAASSEEAKAFITCQVTSSQVVRGV